MESISADLGANSVWYISQYEAFINYLNLFWLDEKSAFVSGLQ